MERKNFYESKVLTDQEYETISGAFADAEDTCNDVMDNLREVVSGVMAKLYEKRTCTELKTANFTLINRIGDITVIFGSNIEGEVSLDDIKSVDTLMDIVSEII